MAPIKIEADFLDPPRKNFDFVDPVDNHHHGPIWQTTFQTLPARNLKPFAQIPDYWSHMNQMQNSSIYMKMESDNGEGITVDHGIFDGSTSSRSSSPILMTDSKQAKSDSKICGVCGDKALGNNFNAVTCESCKAFFRRNALKPKEFVCPFSNNCKVDPVTRRFCQKCRLKKCFDIGMKKEWIMTDEEKKIKKQKIEQNRLKRQSSDTPSSEVPLAKTACMSDFLPSMDQNNMLSVSQSSPPDPTLPHKIGRPMMPHNYEDSSSSFPFSSSSSNKIIMPNTNASRDGLFCITNINSVPVTNYDHANGSTNNTNLSSHENSASSPMELIKVDEQSTEQFPEEQEKLNQNELYVQNQGTANNNGTDHQSVWCDDRPDGSTSISSQASGIFNNKNSNVDTTNFEPVVPTYQTQMPLLSSLMRPGAESPPDAQLVTMSSNIENNIRSTNDVSVLSSPFIVNGHDGDTLKVPQLSSLSAGIVINSNEPYSNEDSCDYSIGSKIKQRRTSCVIHRNKKSTDYEQLPLPLNTMDSIIKVAINAEFNAKLADVSHSVLSGEHISNSRYLNKAEQNKLNELLMASRALNNPVDVEGHDVKVSDPSLINVINLTDIAIRRLIKMSKKISGFKNMCQDDQVALLKGSCTEMMILRSVVSYDPDRDSWNIPHSNEGYNIKLRVLKEAPGNLYEIHQQFVKSFKSEWRCDDNIMIILCAITLFTSERPNVIHKEVVQLEQDSYYYLLKRYLESKLNGCEARSTYLHLIKKIAELHELNSNHLRVFLEVNPREVEPLLIEIFDLK